jgi:hypothetical protein
MVRASNTQRTGHSPEVLPVLVDDISVDEIGLLKGYSLLRIALNLAKSQHAVISDMSYSKLFKVNGIAKVASCNPRSIYRINKNLRCFGSTKAPSNGVGQPQSITPPILDALRKHLLEKPGLYQDDMVDFLKSTFR